MTITGQILNILNALKTQGRIASVLYNSPTKVNVQLDTVAHPVAVLYLFTDGTINVSTGLYREAAEVNVMFLTHQNQLDFTGSANELLVDNMVGVAKDFIAEVLALSTFAIEGDEITVRGVYDFDDKNTTGVSLQFRLSETQGHCL